MNEDALAKLGLRALLSPFVPLRVQHEVQPPVQFVDLFVAAAPASPDALVQTLGTLGQMTCQPTLIEAFSDTVSLAEARSCLRKQLTLHHVLGLEANHERPQGTPPLEVPFPWLWMLSLGEPRTVVESWKLFSARRWPRGIYCGNDVVAVGVVVLRQLEVVRETLTLRLFGDKAMRQQASRELDAMAEEDPMRQAVTGMLYRWRVWLHGHPDDEQVRRRLMDFEQLVEQETRRLRADGRAEGLRDGRAEGLRLAATDLCELLGIELTEARRTHLAGLDLPGLEALWRHLKTHRNWPA